MHWNGEVDYTYETENGKEVCATVRYYYTPGCKQRMYGHPDDWHPAEGAEIEILGVEVDGREMTDEEVKEFSADHEESLYEAIEADWNQGPDDYEED